MNFDGHDESDYSESGSSASKLHLDNDGAGLAGHSNDPLGTDGAIEGPIFEPLSGKIRKPPTSKYFRKTVFCKDSRQGKYDENTRAEHRAIQSMYLAAIEPDFVLTAKYKRITMQRDCWEQFYMAYELEKRESGSCMRPFWFRSDVSETLVSYWDAVLSELGVDRRTSSSFFALVPLCGHSHDLAWLYRQGVCVTGVDFCLFAVETFVKENPSLQLQHKELSDGTEYFISADRRLRIFIDDFFYSDCYMDQQYNFIWDRCSFTCINIDQRKAYTRQIMNCRAENFCMLLETYEYEPPAYALMPHPSSLFEQHELFGLHLTMKTTIVWQNKTKWDGEKTFEFLKPFADESVFARRTVQLAAKLRVTMYIR